MSYTSLYVLPGNKGSVHRVMLPLVLSCQSAWVVAEYLGINSSQARLGAATDFVNDRGGRKEMEALLLIELDLS